MKKIVFILPFLLFISCSKTEKKHSEVLVLSDLEQLNKEINSSPTAVNYNKRATYYLNNNEFELAFEDVQKTLLIDTSFAEIYLTAAKIFRKSFQIPLSLEYAKKAEAKGLATEELFLLMAEEYLILMQYQPSLSYSNKALKVNQSAYLAYFYKGMVYEETNDFKRSVSSYQTAIEQNSNFPDAYNNLIKIYTANKDFEMAYQYIESGLRFLPNDKFIWYNYGVLLENQELLDSAIVIYQMAEMLDNSFDLVKYRMAKTYTQLKKYELAERYFEELINVNPKFIPAYIDFGKLLLQINKKGKANELLRKVLIQNPDNKEIQELYSQTK